jgi:hypothetical protein
MDTSPAPSRGSWDHAPFPTRAQFVQTVERISAIWQTGGLFTEQQRQDVITAATRADRGP